MPLDGNSTMIGAVPKEVTDLASHSLAMKSSFSPELERTVGGTAATLRPKLVTTNYDALTIDAPESHDGVRILNQVSPTERIKLYQNNLESRLDVLQSWEGAVVGLDAEKSEFTARLFDLTDPTAEESEAVFDCSDVSSNDRELLKVGGIFRWMIGYRRYSHGQQERVSAIVFRRLPAWYESDLNDAVKYGEDLAGAISIDDGGIQPSAS